MHKWRSPCCHLIDYIPNVHQSALESNDLSYGVSQEPDIQLYHRKKKFAQFDFIRILRDRNRRCKCIQIHLVAHSRL